MSFGKLYFSFEGRINRQTYWVNGVLVFLVIGFVVGLLDSILQAEGVLIILLQIAVIWPGLAIQAKRWHDRDKSAWWTLITFIPIVGWIWILIELGFLEGTKSENRFGPDTSAIRANQSIQENFSTSGSSFTFQAGSLQSSPPAKQPTGNSLPERLSNAKKLFDDGLIDEAEYTALRQKILKET